MESSHHYCIPTESSKCFHEREKIKKQQKLSNVTIASDWDEQQLEFALPLQTWKRAKERICQRMIYVVVVPTLVVKYSGDIIISFLTVAWTKMSGNTNFRANVSATLSSRKRSTWNVEFHQFQRTEQNLQFAKQFMNFHYFIRLFVFFCVKFLNIFRANIKLRENSSK